MDNQEDAEKTIGDMLMTLANAFAQTTIEGVADLYAEDAEWTNAFGTSRHGRDAIIAYLEVLFADPNFNAGRLLGRPTATIRFVGSGVAIAKTYAEREGQRAVDGQELPVRRNFSIKVLEQQSDGWRIVSDLYMDARDESSLSD